ncbi:MAG: anthranilate synthase component I family protein [Bacteroidetes bacterium]|jgi:anthranilate synthase component 1|nr:anthranilate synthase component I family protein [Bacteroidota bacterium]
MEVLEHKKIRLKTVFKRYLADTVTPVTMYLKLRDHFNNPVLLESNDFQSAESNFSYIGLDPISTIKVQNQEVITTLPDGSEKKIMLKNPLDLAEVFKNFLRQFEVEENTFAGAVNGLFGHTSFDGVQYFDTLNFDPEKRKFDIPNLHYSLYRYIIAFNHYKHELYILENVPEGETSDLTKVETLMKKPVFGTYDFKIKGSETSNLTDEEFKELVRKGKHHCQIGDVFQIVLSRQYQQSFLGDDFQVYRVLRSINPSPYLVYFDYGNYKIFGSSPEAQMIIKNNVATVNPIAGTYRRSGDWEEDQRRASELLKDPKENAEHIMLVDLARNDLGRHCNSVTVKELKEVHYYSHVIHLVSKVDGNLDENSNPIQIFGDTFPAGTLSGAPKYKAIELINKYENQNRSFYGGSIGYIGFNGEMNQAIVIRSFMSKDNVLYYQAGAGIVVASNEENELQEVKNKLGALKKALEEAEKI